ncbi:MAG: hypothetical protein HYR85_23930 [Planctomycetes bacterium]|nr:hypothetical protein [Planctomycetota bacterium]MBI3844022.1 hypothetical protein [Planctomycetota bacterium]
MKGIAAFAGVALVAAAGRFVLADDPNPEDSLRMGADSNQAFDLEAIKAERLERRIAEVEFGEEWKRIRWRSGIDEALADSRREGKPILAVFFLRDFGQADAPMT